MKKEPNVYETILGMAEIAEQMEFEYQNTVEEEEEKIKRVINKPKETKKIPYEAFKQYQKQKGNR